MLMYQLKSGRCIKIAYRFQERLLGLMGRKALLGNEGVYFPKCRAVHTFFMRFPIMVVFCRDGQVVKIIPELKPWRYAVCLQADSVFEFAVDQQNLAQMSTIIHTFFSGISPKKTE